MKYFAVFFYFFLFWNSALLYANTTEQFQQNEYSYYYIEANNYYTQGRFADALVMYQKLLAFNPYEAYFHYNIANIYYQLRANVSDIEENLLAKSVFHYYQALALNPLYEAAKNNLIIALQEFNLQADIHLIEQDNAFANFITQLTTKAQNNPTIWFSFCLLILCVSISVLLWQSVLKSSNLNRGLQLFLIILTILTGSLYVLLIQNTITNLPQKNLNKLYNKAVLLQNSQTQIKPGSIDIIKGFSLDEGQLVKIIKQQDGWVLISLANGSSGWIEEKRLLKFNNTH